VAAGRSRRSPPCQSETVEHDCEEVFAAEAFDNACAIGSDGGGVRVIDNEGFDGRIEWRSEDAAELTHVEQPGRAAE
jgi:hypothetical protein